MKRVLLFLLLTTPGFAQQRYTATGKVVNSRHDLSVSSTGSSYVSTTQTQVCVFCHTPHNANPAAPLWNHKLSTGVNYSLYSSSTLSATMAQPTNTDNTKLCLSCHDGTVALGSTVNDGNIVLKNGVTTLPANAGTGYSPARNTDLGTSLADDHPVAFTPVNGVLPAYPQTQPPAKNDTVQLENGLLQCTTCHNPHEESIDTTEHRFLRKSNSKSAICVTCHALQSVSGAVNKWTWNGSAGQQTDHALATNKYDLTTNDGGITWLGSHTGYPDTATNGCQSCHRSHTAHDAPRLMKGDTDTVCFQCHDGNAVTNILFNYPASLQTTRQNMVAAFSPKTYTHPGTGATQNGHDPDEMPLINNSRHSACDDCHNPHAAKGYLPPLAPSKLSPTLYGVSGVTSTKVMSDPRRNGSEAQNEYEICNKCHGDSTGKPQATSTYTATLPPYGPYGYQPYRATFPTLTDPFNVRLEMTSTNTLVNNFVTGSHHPVMTTPISGLTQSSLLQSMLNLDGTSSTRTLSTGGQIFCTDCHNNDQDRQFLGSGPDGNHGSNYRHVLERDYEVPVPPTRTTPQGAIVPNPGGRFNPLVGSTAFNGVYALCAKCHNLTTVRNGDNFDHETHFNYGCSICHSAHGAQNVSNQGAKLALVDFDLNFVAPDPNAPAPYNTTPAYIKTGSTTTRGGYCYLICHNELHDQNNP